MASEALGLLPGEMQEQFSAGAWMASVPKNEGLLFLDIPDMLEMQERVAPLAH